MPNKLNQKGFGIAGGLLLVLVVAIIAGVGFYVSSANKDKKDITSSTKTQTTKTASTEQKTDQYFAIKELGIKFKKTALLANPVYFDVPEVNTSSSDQKAYFMSTKELVLAVEACNPGEVLEGISKSALSASRHSGQYPVDANVVNNGVLAKQFGEFYISYNTTGPQLCADGTDQEKVNNVSDLYVSVRDAYIDALKAAEQ